MKKKVGISLLAGGIVAGSIMGTVAYYTKSFTSDSNVAQAAKFEVDAVNSKGETIGSGQFNLGEKLLPGMEPMEVYSFQINKNQTEVPVEYKVNLTPSGDLFPQDNSSPVVLKLQRLMGDKWVDLDQNNPFKPESETEKFKVFVSWPHGENDIAFQGKTGNVHLGVVATQVEDPNVIGGNLVETVKGEAGIDGKSEIVVYEFAEGKPAGGNASWIFKFNDGEKANLTILQTIYDYLPAEDHRFDGVRLAKNLVEDLTVNLIKQQPIKNFLAAWDVRNEGTKVIFTSKEMKDFKNVSISATKDRPTSADVKATQTNQQDGSPALPGVKEVNTLTVDGKINKVGNLTVTFSDGSENVEKTVVVAKGDSHAAIAAKIAQVFSGLSGWDVMNAAGSADVVFTAKTASSDKGVTVTFSNN
ncbi:hypothetical protein ACFSO7_02330 [Bacillus sp. CGMCC 1.16607]|uniref:hypothetical protein n=1 Tax=Bacillus sp. CGMCC 1.16607 TaxID=3351842 RepID=UPI003629E140